MPKFEVKLRRNTLHSTTLEVEAEDEDSAIDKALGRAEASTLKGPLEWELDSEDFDVEDSNEIEAEEEDDEDEG